MNKPHRSRRRGFTLIEMIITLSIFLLLTAAVFGIFSATMQSVSALQDDEVRSNQAEALGAWLQKTFLSLPADGYMVSSRRDGVPLAASDVVWSAGGQCSALDLHPQPDGRYTLRLAVSAPGTAGLSEFARQVLQDDSSLVWRPLVNDLIVAAWKFRPQGSLLWEDAEPVGRPDFIQFTFQRAGASQAVVDDCWIPRLLPATGSALNPPDTVTSNP